jgi:hypothetical protein
MPSQARRALLWCSIGPANSMLRTRRARAVSGLGLEAGDVLADALVQAHARPHRAPTGAKDLNLALRRRPGPVARLPGHGPNGKTVTRPLLVEGDRTNQDREPSHLMPPGTASSAAPAVTCRGFTTARARPMQVSVPRSGCARRPHRAAPRGRHRGPPDLTGRMAVATRARPDVTPVLRFWP